MGKDFLLEGWARFLVSAQFTPSKKMQDRGWRRLRHRVNPKSLKPGFCSRVFCCDWFSLRWPYMRGMVWFRFVTK